MALVSVNTATSVEKTMKRRLVCDRDDLRADEAAEDLLDFFTLRLLVRNPFRAKVNRHCFDA